MIFELVILNFNYYLRCSHRSRSPDLKECFGENTCSRFTVPNPDQDGNFESGKMSFYNDAKKNYNYNAQIMLPRYYTEIVNLALCPLGLYLGYCLGIK